MESQIRSCKNCSASFTVETDDFGFYEKMSAGGGSSSGGQVSIPPPTWCPECRSQRRMVIRNESTLYKRPCSLCNASIVSMYHSDVKFPVYCQTCWWSDKWDATEYGKDYDFNRPFFEQFRELRDAVPAIALVNNPAQNVNSPYCNYALQNKDCYLIFGSHYNENCANNWYIVRNRDCFDSLQVAESELVYEANYSTNLYNSAFVEYAFDSRDCFFSYDLRGCNNCFFSYNLRGKSYYIFNQPYSKEEYFKKIKEFDLGSFEKLENLKKKFLETKLLAIRRDSYQKNSVNCTGDDIMESKNIRHGYRMASSEDVAYASLFNAVYHGMDLNNIGYDKSEYIYECVSCTALNTSKFGQALWHCHDVEYGSYNFSSGNCFGCVSVQHKQYCILNKQYTPDEYAVQVSKIKSQMSKNGEYGEFFPVALSPFGYNESIAPDIYPLTKEEAVVKGFNWRDPDAREFQPQTYDLPDHIKDTKDDVLQATLACTTCKKNFRITNMELGFHRRSNISLPRRCFKCRHETRMQNRNPLTLWSRQCSKCSADIQTSYSPDRPEVVYCEQCYQQEVV